MSVSVVVVAKNEAEDIADCLRCVAWAEDRLVVDTGSADATREIAAGEGARVVEHTWLGYAATKNWAFTQTVGDWILSLDADERVSTPLAEEIRTVTSGEGRPAAYEMPRRFYFLNRWLKHGGCYPDWQLRLFRRGQAEYGTELIHERLRVNGCVGRLRGHLDHYSYSTLSEYLSKLDEYSGLWAQQARAQGRRSRWYHSLSLVSSFVQRYVLKAGFLDGRAGLTWAVLAGGHSFMKYAKLAELERRP